MSPPKLTPIINRAGMVIPAFSVVEITGLHTSGFYEVTRPTADNIDPRLLLFTGAETIADDGTSDAADPGYFDVLTRYSGTATTGNYFGTATDSFVLLQDKVGFISRGYHSTLDLVSIKISTAVSGGTGIVVTDGKVIGRIPSNPYSVDRSWILDRYYAAQTAAPPVWRQVNMNLHLEAAGVGGGVAVGVPSPVFGKVVGLTVNCAQRTAHGAGVVDFIPYNATTGGGAPQADAPQLDNLDPLNPTTTGYGTIWSDGLAVQFGDLIELWCRCAAGDAGRNIDFNAEASFIIKEQTAYVITGDALTAGGVSPNGVVVRNGQFGGKSAFERIDGAYWLWWAPGFNGWYLSTAKGVTTNSWAKSGAAIVGAQNPSGTSTGTATVAAYPA